MKTNLAPRVSRLRLRNHLGQPGSCDHVQQSLDIVLAPPSPANDFLILFGHRRTSGATQQRLSASHTNITRPLRDLGAMAQRN